MSDTACLCECPYMEVCVRGSLRENLNIEAHSSAQVWKCAEFQDFGSKALGGKMLKMLPAMNFTILHQSLAINY